MKRTPKPKLIVISKTRSASSLTLEEWRKSPLLVKEAQRLQKDAAFSAMLDVLRNGSPANHLMPNGQTEVDALRQLGRVECFQMVINTLESMSKLIEEPPYLEATFEEETSTPENHEPA